jgi:hypothetical protein
MIRIPSKTTVIGRNELTDLINSLDEAQQDFETLCRAGCSRDALAYLLLAMQRRIQIYAGPGDEVRQSRKARRKDAELLKKAAAAIERRHYDMVPNGEWDSARIENLEKYEAALAATGRVPPGRLVRALRDEASSLSEFPEQLASQFGLRPNQDFFDTISRYILCGYVRQVTRHWYDNEISSLLLAVGNTTNPAFDADLLRKWRRTNFKRLQLFSHVIDSLVAVHHRQSPT